MRYLDLRSLLSCVFPRGKTRVLAVAGRSLPDFLDIHFKTSITGGVTETWLSSVS